MKNFLFSATILLLCLSCSNNKSKQLTSGVPVNQGSTITISVQPEEIVVKNDTTIENQLSMTCFEIPEDSYFKDVITNFHKYRKEERLFKGLEMREDSLGEGWIGGPTILDLQFSDTLLILNFDKGTVRGVKRSSDEEDPNPYSNYIKGFPTERTITGDFNGDGKKDSLMVENIELLLHYHKEVENLNFIFSDKSIPDLEVWGCLDYTIKNEGDLDGDGGDEIGFLYCKGSSGCHFYNVFTLKNNTWSILIEDIELTRDMRRTGITPVENDSEQEGVILVRSSATDAVCCCTPYVIEKCIYTPSESDLRRQKILY